MCETGVSGGRPSVLVTPSRTVDFRPYTGVEEMFDGHVGTRSGLESCEVKEEKAPDPYDAYKWSILKHS